MASESAPKRLNKIVQILKSKSYLEIGVQKGLTFHNINVPFKEAVDPILGSTIYQWKTIKQDITRLQVMNTLN